MAAQEQSASLQEINIAVNRMDQDTEKNAAMIEETTAVSHGLAQEVASPNWLIGQFDLGAETEHHAERGKPLRPARRPLPLPAMPPSRPIGGSSGKKRRAGRR